ncbi:hypothetical protein LCGC14_0579910 [marine sediment metagenome]|uniref:Uncharacterized protein n=1 Tax=marine sediment metagenome TaxID=412755 RepID=A0A0F9RLR9_9ZZZZ
MTTQEYIEDYLVNCMLFPEQAKQIVEAFKLRPEAQSIRWDTPIDGYPTVFHAALKLSIDAEALEWIDKNMPKHFARPMFDHTKSVEMSEKTRVILAVHSGCVSAIQIPPDVSVEIRDYDIVEDMDREFKTDNEGDKYEEMILK